MSANTNYQSQLDLDIHKCVVFWNFTQELNIAESKVLPWALEQYQGKTVVKPIDTTPIILNEVSYKKRKFRFKRAEQFYVSLDEESKHLFAENQDLGINAYGTTREGLLNEISEQIAFLWDEFASAKDSGLTPEAQKLKYYLLGLVETNNAA
jgi:hypothetical protein